MEFDKNQIMNKIGAMSDDELKNVIRTIAESAGISSRKADQAVSDIDKIRKGFSGMSEKDWKNAMSMLDSNTVDNIKRQMNM